MWSVIVGSTLPFAIALLLKRSGHEDAAELVLLPGWIVILRATGGFFASLGVVGNIVFLGTTALVYSAFLFCLMRLGVACQRLIGRTRA